MNDYKVNLRFPKPENDLKPMTHVPFVKEIMKEPTAETDERAQFFVEENGELSTFITPWATIRSIRTSKSENELSSALPPPERGTQCNVISEFVLHIRIDGVRDNHSQVITNADALLDGLTKIRGRGYTFTWE